MGAPAAGSVVLVPFPFSDLSQSKLRPAIVLADAGRDDWILCQVTSNAYADPKAVELRNSDFDRGGLQLVSYARPAKLFTAHQNLFVSQVGNLQADSLKRITDRVASIFQQKE